MAARRCRSSRSCSKSSRSSKNSSLVVVHVISHGYIYLGRKDCCKLRKDKIDRMKNNPGGNDRWVCGEGERRRRFGTAEKEASDEQGRAM